MEDKRRRVLIRVIGAPLLLAALAAILFRDHVQGDPTGLLLVLLFMSAVSLHEICAMARLREVRPFEPAALLALGLLYAAEFGPLAAQDLSWPLRSGAAGVLLAGSAVAGIARGGRSAGATLLATGYVSLGLTVTFWTPFRFQDGTTDTLLYLAFLFAANKGSDMAAYSFGKMLGRRKLAPRISPNKTWEGAVAGLLAGGGLGAWILLDPLRHRFGSAPPWALVATALAVTVAAQLGDLLKSAIKRWAGVKDSGRLLPEFGGALDMIDTFLLSAPVAWILVRVLQNPGIW